MAAGLVIASYAKLNLALRVAGKRPDGFHELETLFERINLHDDLALSAAPEGQTVIECDHPGVPVDGRNLVFRAAALVRECCRVNYGVRFVLTKRIPVAAGLAGGSSNAAAALSGLNVFWKLGLSRPQLLAMARKLGSDVAFFLYETPFGLGTGRGEKIRPFSLRHKFWHVLVTPKAPLLTKDVYAAWDASLTKESSAVTMLVSSLRKNDISSVRRQLFNDLERPIRYLRPELASLFSRMDKAASGGVCFSGSGPSVFALVKDQSEAERVALKFRGSYSQVFAVSTF